MIVERRAPQPTRTELPRALEHGSVVLLLAPASATLDLEGSSSSILFNNSARITATCSNAPPPPPLSPSINRMKPKVFAPLYAGAELVLRLEEVVKGGLREAGERFVGRSANSERTSTGESVNEHGGHEGAPGGPERQVWT